MDLINIFDDLDILIKHFSALSHHKFCIKYLAKQMKGCFIQIFSGYGPVQEKPPELVLASDFTVLTTEKSEIW